MQTIKLWQLQFQQKSKRKAWEQKSSGLYKFFTSSSNQKSYIDEYDFIWPALIFGTWWSASVHFCDEKFSTSTDCFILKTDNNEINLKYVSYFIKWNINILENWFKWAWLKHISKEYLSNLEIPLPSSEEQKLIVKKLDKISDLINLKKVSIKKTEKLTKSVFLEMFGDPILNPKKWNKVLLWSLFSSDWNGVKCWPFGSALKKEEYTSSWIPVWTMENIVNDKFKKEWCLYISELKYTKLWSYSVMKWDLIISRAWTVWKMCLVDYIWKSIISTNLIKLSLDRINIVSEFFIESMYFIKNSIKLKTWWENAFTHMNTWILKNIEIFLPPITIQNKFLQIFENNQKNINTQKQLLNKLEELYKTTLQETFNF